MSNPNVLNDEPITKVFGVELSAEEINQVSGAMKWPDIKIEESENPSLSVTFSAVEVTVEF